MDCKLGGPRSSLTVLVVDDDPSLAQNMVLALNTCGFTAHSTPNSQGALAAIERSHDIGVVITDVRMPGDDGLALAGHVRKLVTPDRAIEVIVTTGYATTDTVTQALRAGASDFLCKPFRLTAIVEAVDEAMRRAIATRTAYRQHEELIGRIATFERAHQPMPISDAENQRQIEELNAISHGLRTPLHIALGGLSLQEATQSPRCSAGAEALHSGIHDMLRAIELVEALHRSHLAPSNRAPIPVRLHALLQECCTTTSSTPMAQPPRLHAEAASACVTAVPADVTQAINLCVESLASWPSGDGDIAIRLHSLRMHEQSWTCITIQRGECEPMADPVLPRQGTGMSRTLEGLAFMTARRLLERDGGQVSSHSANGRQGMIRIAWPEVRHGA